MIHSAYLQHSQQDRGGISMEMISLAMSSLAMSTCAHSSFGLSLFSLFPFFFFLHLDVLEKNDSPPLVGLWEHANESLKESLTFWKVSLFLLSFLSFPFLSFSFSFPFFLSFCCWLNFKILFSSFPQMKCNRSFISKKGGEIPEPLASPSDPNEPGDLFESLRTQIPTPAAATPAVTLCFST